MRTSYEKLTARDNPGPSSNRLLKAAGLLALGLVVGMLVGVGLGSSSNDAGKIGRSGGSTVSAGFIRSCNGAALAIGEFFERMNSAEIALDPDASRAAIDEMATGQVATEMKAAVDYLVEPYAAGAIGREYRAGTETLQVGVPVAYRVRECSGDRVVVRLWTVTVRGNATNVWPMQFWRTVQTSVEWINGRWQIVDGWNRDGPIPYWTQRPLPDRKANQALVMRITGGMRSFGSLR